MNRFEKTVTNTWGEIGKKWLKRLPSIITKLADHWSLQDIKPVKNMSYNYVALAMQHKNQPVALKISCDSKLIFDEYRALKHFNGCGAIRIINIDKKNNALLLEQAIPGLTLKENPPTDIKTAYSIYQQIIKKLSSQPHPKDHYIHAEKWCDAIDRIQDPRINQKLIDKAKELKSFLLSSSKKEYLCHGDLHFDNITQHNDAWLAIDPKGIIGETAFEAAAFDLIEENEWEDSHTIQEKITTRIGQFASALNIDKNRLLSWYFVRAVISAQWFIEDNGNPDNALRLAAKIYPLLKTKYSKKDVYETYEIISDWYTQHRSQDLFEKPYLDKIITLIKPEASILDLGCGTGRPIAEYFISKGFSVTGVDGSQKQINKAQENLPTLIAIHQDMRELNVNKTFDCIIAWHSYFHLPKEDQRKMFNLFHKHIKPGGILVFTSGTNESEQWSDNGGEMLYHASLNTSEYHALLSEHQFTVICHKVKDPDCGNATIWVSKYNPTL